LGNTKTGCAKVLCIRPCSGAAACKLAVDDYGRDGLYTVLLGLRSDIGLVHIEHLNVTRRASKALYEFDGRFTRWAPSAKNFNCSFVRIHNDFSCALN